MADRDPQVTAIIFQAVGQPLDEWAQLRPSLARIIDRLEVHKVVAEKLRETPEYHQALQAFHDSNNELQFLEKLVELAGPILTALLAL